MLLHLLTNKINAHSTEFERKWNQLLPRRQPVLPKVNYFQPMTNESGATQLHGAAPQEQDVVNSQQHQHRPQGFESNFVPLTAQTSTTFNARNNAAETTPVNELSLAAELSEFNAPPAPVEGVTTPVNAVSLADELQSFSEGRAAAGGGGGEEAAFMNDSVESRLNDDIIILDSAGDLVGGATAGEEPGPEPTDLVAQARDVSIDVALNEADFMSPIVTATNNAPDAQLPRLSVNGTVVTSTPKRPTAASGDAPSTESAQQASLPPGTTTTTTDPTSSLFQTAVTSQPSPQDQQQLQQHESRGSSSSSADDRSILGQKKFAAMLQTVVTSLDDESGSWSMDITGTSFEAIPEEDGGSLAGASNDVFMNNDVNGVDTDVVTEAAAAEQRIEMSQNPQVIISGPVGNTVMEDLNRDESAPAAQRDVSHSDDRPSEAKTDQDHNETPSFELVKPGDASLADQTTDTSVPSLVTSEFSLLTDSDTSAHVDTSARDAEGSSDVPNVSDVAGPSDVSNISDVAGPSDATNISDVAGPSDASNANSFIGGTDASNVSDVTGASDAANMFSQISYKSGTTTVIGLNKAFNPSGSSARPR